jgi:hypothetical protein
VKWSKFTDMQILTNGPEGQAGRTMARLVYPRKIALE